MSTYLFDTLAYARKLEAAGMPTLQAEKLAELQGEIFRDQSQRQKEAIEKAYLVATKTDIQTLREAIAELNRKIQWLLDK